MSLGERLQQLRKEKQMSQEELGNLLLVSRQTVSLWENNQTVPTVDNLIRLREIFGISIDSILTGEEPAATEAAPETDETVQTEQEAGYYYTPPFEGHFFSLQRKDLKYIYKLFNAQPLRKLIVWVFILFFSIFVTFTDSSEEQNSFFGFWLAFIFFSVMLVKYIQSLLATKKEIGNITSRSYAYEMYQNYMIIRVFNNQDEIKNYKVYPNEFNRCWETPYCYFLERNDKTIFTVKKEHLNEHSAISSFCQRLKTGKTDFSSVKVNTLKTASHILFIGCFISLFTAISLVGIASDTMPVDIQQTVKHLSIFHYFLPIPIASIVVGILLNVNKIRNRKNIVCGIMIGIMMLVYGFFPAIYGNIDTSLDSIEAQTGFDFPEYIGMNQRVTTNLAGDSYALITLHFADSVADGLEESMIKDERWLTEGRSELSDIIINHADDYPTDFYMLYNIKTNEFGKLPDSSGEYEFIYIAYDTEMNTAYIYEYTADYHG